MKTLLKGLLFCAVSMVLNSIPVSAWDFPVSIDITQISFNHSESEAIPLKKDYGTTSITAPEWRKTFGGDEEDVYKDDRFAYIIGATPTVKATFTSPDPDPTVSITITVQTCSIDPEDGFEEYTGWSLNDDEITFPWGPLDTEGIFSTQYGTSVKNGVGKCRTKFLWKISEVGGSAYSQELGYSTHKYYTVLDTPVAPMDEPWTEVLDYSCDWTFSKTSETVCVDSLTMKLFNSGIKYDPNQGYTTYYSIPEPRYEFDLGLLLEDLSSPGEEKMCCVDFSHFFNVLSASIGIQCYWERTDEGFYTREILSAGNCTSDQWDNYSVWCHDEPDHITRFTFDFHQFSTIYNGGYKIIDAALLLYIPDNGYLSDPVNFQFQRGINSYSTYRSLLTDEWVDQSSENSVTEIKP
jgi:hypothetical protein